MHDMKWSAVFVVILSLVAAGCCNQPCSWCNWCGRGNNYVAPPPPTYPAYPPPVTGPVTTGPMTMSPVTTGPVTTIPSASMPTTTLR